MPDIRPMRQAVIDFFNQCAKLKKLTESKKGIKIQLTERDLLAGDTLLIKDDDLLKTWPNGIPESISLDEIGEAIGKLSAIVYLFVVTASPICTYEKEQRESEAREKEEAARRSKLRLYTLTSKEMDRLSPFQYPQEAMRERGVPEEEISDKFSEFLKEIYGKLRTAAELHYLALNHNFSDIEILPLMTHNPRMDRGTALTLFWNRGLPELLRTPREEVDEYTIEAYEIAIDLLDRLKSGFYTTELFRFVPDPSAIADKQIAVRIPAKLKKPIKGEFDGVFHPRDKQLICE